MTALVVEDASRLLLFIVCPVVAAVLAWMMTGVAAEVADVTTVQYRQHLHVWLAGVFGFAAPILAPDLNPVRVAGLTAAAALMALLAVTDAGQEILPNRLSLALFITTCVLTFGAGDFHRAGVALACGLGVFASYWLMLAIRPHQFGGGDVKLGMSWGMLIGWFGPWPVLWAFALGFLFHGAVGIYLIARGAATSTRVLLPMGPMMICAAYSVGACYAV